MRRAWLVGSILAFIASCAPTAPNTPIATTAPPPVQAVPFPDAVLNAANAVFSSAPVSSPHQVVVIDPLVNGVTGEQSTATQQIQDRIVALAREKYPQFDIEPFTAATVSKAPYVMVGTFTPVNARGQTAGIREAFRFCLVMVDLHAGKTVAKGVARARTDGVDSTPISFFRDSPAWSNDANIKSYIDTCQATKVGDAISQTYLNGILTASIISEAINAYDASRYRDALDLYVTARENAGGQSATGLQRPISNQLETWPPRSGGGGIRPRGRFRIEQQHFGGEDSVPARLDSFRYPGADHRPIRYVAEADCRS